jgi:hypothetical protein
MLRASRPNVPDQPNYWNTIQGRNRASIAYSHSRFGRDHLSAQFSSASLRRTHRPMYRRSKSSVRRLAARLSPSTRERFGVGRRSLGESAVPSRLFAQANRVLRLPELSVISVLRQPGRELGRPSRIPRARRHTPPPGTAPARGATGHSLHRAKAKTGRAARQASRPGGWRGTGDAFA